MLTMLMKEKIKRPSFELYEMLGCFDRAVALLASEEEDSFQQAKSLQELHDAHIQCLRKYKNDLDRTKALAHCTSATFISMGELTIKKDPGISYGLYVYCEEQLEEIHRTTKSFIPLYGLRSGKKSPNSKIQFAIHDPMCSTNTLKP